MSAAAVNVNICYCLLQLLILLEIYFKLNSCRARRPFFLSPSSSSSSCSSDTTSYSPCADSSSSRRRTIKFHKVSCIGPPRPPPLIGRAVRRSIALSPIHPYDPLFTAASYSRCTSVRSLLPVLYLPLATFQSTASIVRPLYSRAATLSSSKWWSLQQLYSSPASLTTDGRRRRRGGGDWIESWTEGGGRQRSLRGAINNQQRRQTFVSQLNSSSSSSSLALVVVQGGPTAWSLNLSYMLFFLHPAASAAAPAAALWSPRILRHF